jgi:uncharacterized protein (DUF885 family)
MRYNDRWTDRSLAAILARQAADRAALERLRAIDRAALTADQQLKAGAFMPSSWATTWACTTTRTTGSGS